MTQREPLLDTFGRVHTDLRISVTDRCNIRCFYCMPADNVSFMPKDHLLSFEEMTRFVKVASELGVKKVRLTGGEPLVRADFCLFIKMIKDLGTIEDIAVTTNGLLLAEYAEQLKQSGVNRLNISLDALSAPKFKEITRRDGFEKVLEGIFKAKEVGFEKIKLNAVAIRGISEEEIVPFGQFSREHDLQVRFIEYMPLDADGNWDDTQVLSGTDIRSLLEKEIGPLKPLPVTDPSQPAMDYQFVDGRGEIGFINPVTEPFCHRCNRLRITAEGQIRNCLFSTEEWDARAILREQGTDDELAELIRQSVLAKKAGHGINSDDFERPERAMYQIGG
jgi:cyclic pyranopterin phosphate synthase